MSNLENLRKQAKQILRWHRDGENTVAPILRAHRSEFESLSDQQILDAPFKLADAQEVVARREGFESWSALLHGHETMKAPETKATHSPLLTAAEPQLFVTDLPAALEFYQSVLGFSVRFSYGEPPFYAQVFRDAASLNLRLVHEPVMSAELVKSEELLAASITVKNVKELFLEFREAEAEFHQSLVTQPWGSRTFIVKDREGNLLLFAE
ncbi:MAG: VOC family protein [Armatimonadetes bacterium]|nr:VOC family protein [Armatimonadota bacterium]